MKISRVLILVLTILIVAVFFKRDEAMPSEILREDSQAQLESRTPGIQKANTQTATSQPRAHSSTNPQSSPSSSLSGLPDSEQKSLWKAFSEARREARPIPESWAQREENIGYDFYALHPKQNLTTRFGSQGVQFVSSDRTYSEEDEHNSTTAWEARMHLLSFAGSNVPLGAPAEKTEGSSSRVEYRHRAELTEWYDNGVAGMEHGYTIAQRPRHLQSGEEVVLEVALEGLKASQQSNENGSHQLNFLDGERTVLSYSKLLVFDAQGKELPATMKPTDSGFTLAYNDTQATYPVTVDPLIVNEEAKFNRVYAKTGDRFGYSVAIAGDSVVIGAYQSDDGGTSSGSAYVFIRTGTSWSLQGRLTANDAAAFDNFGFSVAISGDSVIVSAVGDDDGNPNSGSAYIFTRSGLSWSLQDKLTANDAATADNFGYSVAMSGDSVVVGAYQDDDGGPESGSAYVFTRSGSSWSQQDKLTANDAAADEYFGVSVGMSGDSVIIGAHQDDDGGTKSGSAYVFTRSGTSWSQQDKLTAGDAAVGDFFGTSVAISGDSAVIGATGNDSNGSAYVFTRSGSSWSQQDKLTASDAAVGDNFGISVAISGDSVVAGAYQDDDNGSASGSAYVFTRSGISWSQQQKLTAGDAAAGDYFGFSVAISGDSVVAGAYQDDDSGSASGSAYIFTRSGVSWSQQQKLTAGDAAIQDSFGVSVAIAGDTVVVGAYRDDDGGTDSGSAYIFTRSGSSWFFQAKLLADDAAAFDRFGQSVSISGESVIVGAPNGNNGGVDTGCAYVFTRSGGTWTQKAKLLADDGVSGDGLGISVAISGDSVVVGAYEDYLGGNSYGSAYVFTRNGSAWSQQGKLATGDARDIDNFGISVAISGDTVVVGAEGDEDGNLEAGNAYIFTRSGNSWSLQAKLTASDAVQDDKFGRAVAISGDSVIVGAPESNLVSIEPGNAYIFTRSGTTWTEQAKLTASDAAGGDDFGLSVDISGDSVVVGASGGDDHGSSSGCAYIFTRSGSTWSQEEKLTASDATGADIFGRAVAISGDSVVVGAERNDDGGTNSGSAYIFRFAIPGSVELLVYDHQNSEILNGGAASIVGLQLDTSADHSFRLTNAGALALDIQSVTLGGADAAQFSLTVPDISSTTDLLINESLDYTITFSPTGSSAQRNATVIVISNDLATPVFTFSVSGLGLSNSTDGDADGMNDWGEYLLRGFGFDWTTTQTNKVSDYYEFASAVGLFTESQIAAVNVSTSLVEVDPNANTAAIVIGLEESDDITNFNPITAELSKIIIDGNGKIRYEVDTSADKKFIRAGVGE